MPSTTPHVGYNFTERHPGYTLTILVDRRYAWYRIIGESTYVLHEYGEGTMPHNLQFVVGTISPQSSTQESGPGSRLDDFLRLELRPEDSDLDLLVDPMPGATLFDLGGLQVALEELLGIRVDLLTPGDLPQRSREKVLREALPV